MSRRTNRRERLEKRKERRMRQRRIGLRTSRKLIGLFLLVVVCLAGLALRITYINASQGERYARIVQTQAQQQYSSATIPYRRGDITDRNGTILASSEKEYNVILDCKVVNTEVSGLDGTSSQTYLEPTVKALVDVLGIDEASIRKLLTDDATKNSQYQILKTGLSITDKQKFEEYTDVTSEENAKLTDAEKEEREDIKGVWFEEKYVRTYPLNSLACDTIGFTYDGTTADWGIEGYYSDILNGVDGRQYGYYTDNADVEQSTIAAKDGDNVVSTIDVNVQQIIRDALEAYENEQADNEEKNNGAENVGVVVMDPNTGEVLGLDSDKWYDLNNPRDLTPFYSEKEIKKMSNDDMMDALSSLWQNFTISNAFEPGSVYKPITVAEGYTTGVLNDNSTFICDGGQQVADKYIACEGTHGQVTVDEAVKYSCNDALMQIGALIGEKNFLKYDNIFNFGMKTGIDLPGESSGLLFDADTMGPVELATSSFGQGFTVTMIQEAAAISAAINGGYYYKPHVVKQITDENGAVVQTINPVLERRTNTEAVSEKVREAMGTVMEYGGTGYVAKIPGYSMGGKTGTAEKLPRGNNKYILSFIGFAPLNDPKVVVYVTVDEPNAENQESSCYAESIARNIFTELLPYMNIFPDEDGYTASDVDTGFVTSEQMIDKAFSIGENGPIYTVTDASSSGDDGSSGNADTGSSTTEAGNTVTGNDTTVGTAQDGTDLPTVDIGSEDTESGNDYFTDGVSNEDLSNYLSENQ
ncbi:peptidoglycan D,D-transpeptidase FtsI family protein [Bilifractor sp. LCP19S3_H10]|uniref:peptidoglycan D,D-transpeptidase FtsI family protein n=1 Tax=Bilifractor sp. LCP19S3_H10 TaxID=3438736 RepID=UPI003F8F1E8B